MADQKTNQKESLNFIEIEIEKDLDSGRYDGRVHTRFPPEPNGYLHIGHSKAIVVNFELAKKYGGKTNLRFDDTNPSNESVEYVEAIKRDVKWLGYDWEDREYFASDYFETLYELAIKLIKKGKAYVDDSSPEEIAEMKGTPTEPGKPSPYRERSIEENLKLFKGMRAGEYPDGSRVLRAKIDMASPNMHMRDPLLYRIKRVTHHRTGDDWPIYPMYDFAHGQSDALERITHSLCSLEFQNHRPLYNWLIQELDLYPSRQIEFARLNLNYTIMSKRKLLRLVEGKYVHGWDDPRMPTISGLRRRGFTPESIRTFADKVGVAKRNNVIDVSLLEYCIREDLNKKAARVMTVLDPLKVVITNYPEDETEQLPVENNPEDQSMGSRNVPFSREIYIDRKDFMEDPPKKFFRLGPGRNVRLKSAFIIHCDDYVTDPETGEVLEVHCTYYPESRSGQDTSGIKAKGTLHWVSIEHAQDVEVRLYDRLFKVEDPEGDPDKDFTEFINKNSLQIVQNAKAEPNLKGVKPGDTFQFLRLGYFCVDPDTSDGNIVFNRTATLRDTWAKIRKQQKQQKKKKG